MSTFWGACALKEGIDVGTILAIKGAKISDYGGKSLNVSDDCTIQVDPRGEEKYVRIQRWFKESGGTTQQLTQIGGGQGTGPSC